MIIANNFNVIDFVLANVSYAIYVVPNTAQVQQFASLMNRTWVESGEISNPILPHPINLHSELHFIFLATEAELEVTNSMVDNPYPVHLAIVFSDDPMTNM